ncbi:L-aspartate oxidase [Paraliobacillus ryukyuensis]|uniref:L-aspartate oxidase n=1 Tax=Paraliobacillus ryukyuensis TaxID=200904 RepID=UPI001FE41A4E|nr:L-aspartate oxidase [Paraliobacillus ryukyuensis]
MTKIKRQEDVVIIGGGISACTVAMQLYPDRKVTLITKDLTSTNTARAQGGIATVVHQSDSWLQHYQDTITAGYDMNNKQAVELLVKNGRSYIDAWIDKGFAFDRNEQGRLLAGKEGAHRHARILHAGGDQTGKNLMAFLYRQLKDNITIISDQTVIQLLVNGDKCFGVQLLSKQHELSHVFASDIVLATGGCGGLFEITSNHPSILGEGISLAYHAGATISDLEFIQFHPTLLWKDNKSYGLISEAVRGEGAYLTTNNNRRIMEDHPLNDLAPRDVVARYIADARASGEDVFLDISMITDFTSRFPTITKQCQQAGIKLDQGLIPVAPGAHFLMGGVVTDSNGATKVKHLYAVGEVANTGVHGANRLASNSLLEGLVFGYQVANAIKFSKSNEESKERQHFSVNTSTQSAIHLPSLSDLRHNMSQYMGIYRDHQGLLRFKQWLEQFDLVIDLAEVPVFQKAMLHQTITTWLMVTSALKRTESRGAHYRRDFPIVNEHWNQVHIEQTKQQKRQKIGTGRNT